MNMKTFIKIDMKLLGARDWVTAALAELIWQKLQGAWGQKHTHTHTHTQVQYTLSPTRGLKVLEMVSGYQTVLLYCFTCGKQSFLLFTH